MAMMRGGHLTEKQQGRLLVGQLNCVSPHFISALQQLDELSVMESNAWREGAFRELKENKPELRSATGVLQQTYSRSDCRYVIVTLAETSGKLELGLHWNDGIETCTIQPQDAHDIQRWQIKGGPMVWDRLHNARSLKAA